MSLSLRPLSAQASRVLLLRPAAAAAAAARFPRTADLARSYATYRDMGQQPGATPSPRRRNVTVLSDDGRYEWGELSGREKVARATQQSVNFAVILVGAALTVRLNSVPKSPTPENDNRLMAVE